MVRVSQFIAKEHDRMGNAKSLAHQKARADTLLAFAFRLCFLHISYQRSQLARLAPNSEREEATKLRTNAAISSAAVSNAKWPASRT
jgi:hypothetical protein